MKTIFAGLLVAASALASTPAAAAEMPRVVVSIKPLHSLVATLMQGVGTPFLLLDDRDSPHGYSLRPRDAQALSDADVVVWVGPALESFLVEPLETLATNAEVLEAMEVPGLELLPPREGGLWAPHNLHGEAEEHDHEHHASDDEDEHEAEHAHHEHGEEEVDPHLWLDPANARAVAQATAQLLTARDPDNAGAYTANLARLTADLEDLDADLESQLQPVRQQPFVVFHDAFQYLEKRYGLAAAGSVAVSPEQRPGARRIAELRHLIEERGARCVFAEPQFSSAILETLVEGTKVGYGILDPLGYGVAAGPGAYRQIMEDMGQSLSACLTPSG